MVHRLVGLVLAGFLVLLGVTGSLMPFYRDLDRALSPQLRNTSGSGPTLDPLQLREQLLARHPDLRADAVPLAVEPGDALMFLVGPKPGRPTPPFDELYVDPHTGRELGGRLWGDVSEGLVNLMPFVYRLHYSLASGSIGTRVLGMVALLWTVDCFVGAYLTFPLRSPSHDRPLMRHGPGWWARWRRAWSVRTTSGAHRLNVDLHRAGGLWLWAAMLVLAWSAVSFNLQAVYRPVMGALFGTAPPAPMASGPLADGVEPDWTAARARARTLMHEAADAAQVGIRREESLALDRAAGTWRYVVTTDRDLRTRGGATLLTFDAATGAFLSLVWATGQDAAQTITTWISDVHRARIGGVPLRVALSAIAMAVVLLSVTGVTIWLKKRAGRRAANSASRAS